ncbi:AAA family ATPase [Bradyrhizobium barranii]
MFDTRALPDIEVKGLPQPVSAWQVLGEAMGVSRFDARRADSLSVLVGRQEEIELLLRRWTQAKSGAGRVVLISGEPGIGKSRIVESLLASLEDEQHSRLRYYCSPHHTHSALYPFITQLERVANFEPGSSAGARIDRLEALLAPATTNLPRDVALIAELVGVLLDGRYPSLALSPQEKREKTLNALLNQLLAGTAQAPRLIVIEDAHWIDPTSLDLLDAIAARAANLPLLLLVTIRPEFQPSWIGHPHVTLLPLSRLGRSDSAGIIDDVAGGQAAPRGHRRADPVAHRRHTIVHRGADPHAARARAVARGIRQRWSGAIAAIARHSGDLASLAGRSPRSAGRGEGCRLDRRGDRAGIFLRADRRNIGITPCGSGRRPRTVVNLRPRQPPRLAAPGELHVQARAGAGRRLCHDAEEPQAAIA